MGSISLEESQIILSLDLWTFLFLIAVFTSLDIWCGKVHSHLWLCRNIGPTPLLTGLWLLFVEEWLAFAVCATIREPTLGTDVHVINEFSIRRSFTVQSASPRRANPSVRWERNLSDPFYSSPHCKWEYVFVCLMYASYFFLLNYLSKIIIILIYFYQWVLIQV